MSTRNGNSKPEEHSYPCREREFMEIYEFIREHICGFSGGCMSIAGMPGTGKTATVSRVMDYLKTEKLGKRIPDFIHCEINGMKLTAAKQAYSVLAKDVFGQPKTMGPANALRMLDRHYHSENAKEKSSVVVIVDEMDLLYTKPQKVLYNLFEWPQQPDSRLIIISMANTMNLSEKMLMSRIESRLAFHRLAFQPYTRLQLEQVVRYQLKDTKLDDHALSLAANKIASISGDARRVLEVCRTAAAIAERRAMTKWSAAIPKLPAVEVTALDVDAACAEMTTNDPIYNYLQCASGLEKALLKSVVMEFERTGTEQAEMEPVLDNIRDYYHVAGKKCPPVSSSLCAVSTLAALHILIVETKCSSIIQSRISLNCSASVVKLL